MKSDFLKFVEDTLENIDVKDHSKIQIIIESLFNNKEIMRLVNHDDLNTIDILGCNYLKNADLSGLTSMQILEILRQFRCQLPTNDKFNFVERFYSHSLIRNELRKNSEELSKHVTKVCLVGSNYLPVFFDLLSLVQINQDTNPWVLKECLLPICKLYKTLEDLEGKNKLLLFFQTYILKSRALQQYLENIFNKIPPKKLISAFPFLFELMRTKPSEDVTSVLECIFEAAFTCSYFDELTRIRFFIFICHFIGFEQKIVLLEDDKCLLDQEFVRETLKVTSTDLMLTTSFSVLKTLLTSFSNDNIQSTNLHIDIVKNKSALDFFQKLAMEILKLETTEIADLFSLLIKVDPAILENKLKSIFKKLINSNSCEDSVIEFCCSSLEVFSKFHRANTFIDKMTYCAKYFPVEFDLKLENGLFSNHFTKTVLLMTHSNIVKLLNNLLSTLNGIFSSISDQQDLPLGGLRVLCFLLSKTLRNFPLPTESRSLGMWNEISELLLRLKEILGIFGSAILKRHHNHLLMQSFLIVCLDWAELNILLSEYGPEELKVDFNINGSTRLSKLHFYLTEDQWSVFAERITNFGDDKCIQLFISLEMQRIRVIKLKADYAIDLKEADALAIKIITVDKKNMKYFKNDDLLEVISSCSLDNCDKIVAILIEGINDIPIDFIDNQKFVSSAFRICIRKSVDLMSDKRWNWKLLKQLKSYPDLDLIKFKQKLEESIIKVNYENENYEPLIIFNQQILQLPLHYLAKDEQPILAITALMASHPSLFFKLHPALFSLAQNSPNLPNILNIGALIEFIENSSLNSETKMEFIELFVKKAFECENGQSQINAFIRRFRKTADFDFIQSHIFTQVSLYQSLRKCLVRSKQGEKLNDEIGRQRRRLNKSLHRVVNNSSLPPENDITSHIEAYTLELHRVIRLNKLNLIPANFNAFFEFVLKQIESNLAVSSCFNFLNLVVKNLNILREHLPKNIIQIIWERLSKDSSQDFGKLNFDQFAGACSDEEFIKCLDNLFHEIARFFDQISTCEARFSILLDILCTWLKLSDSQRQNLTIKKLKLFFVTIQFKLPKLLTIWLNFLKFCASRISMDRGIENYLWNYLQYIPQDFSSQRIEIFISLTHDGTKFTNRIPIVQYNFSFIVKNIANCSNSAFLLEKWTKTLISKKDVLIRVVAYFISEIIYLFTSRTVDADIKLHLDNMLNNFYDIADEHVIEYLMRALPAAEHQIFEKSYQNYKKYYKFKGKI